MFFQLVLLEFKKSFRSTSFAKSALVAIFLGLVALILMVYVLALGFALKPLLENLLPDTPPFHVVCSGLIYFYLFEFLYRYFIQKLPVIDLQSFLHLPISKKKIMQVLLLRSFISPLSVIAIFLFGPFALVEVATLHGAQGAFFWLATVVGLSWTLHWFILWFKQKFEDSLFGVAAVFVLMLLGFGSNLYGWFDLGGLIQPFFFQAASGFVPLLIIAGLCVLAYIFSFRYYVNNAYLEEISPDDSIQFANRSFGFLSRFGLAGELAELEWKLIIRHKKSRTYITLCAFFLLYGLIFYRNPAFVSSDGGFSHMFIFVGIFITGIFLLQYGQLFLSWNSSNFDFFMINRNGIASLIKGKYLLFALISSLCFILSVPYVFFGWQFLWIHLATFLFNMGIVMPLVLYVALWKPKPMDLNKGAMFNYEGVGAAQFLIMIPAIALPYAIYLPIAMLGDQYIALFVLGLLGVGGILFAPKAIDILVDRVMENKYEISASFRQEI